MAGPAGRGPGRGLTTIGLVISDPVAFADAFLGAVSAGFWVAPLDPVHARRRQRWPGRDPRAHRRGPRAGRPPGTGRHRRRVERARPPGAPAGRARHATRGDGTAARRRGRRRPSVVGHDRHAQGGPLEPGAAPAHGTLRGGAPGARERRPRVQPAAALPHQRRGRGPAVGPGGRLQPGPRRPLPPQRLLGPHGQSFHHLDQRGAGHRLAAGHARPRRDRPTGRAVHPLGVGPVAGGRGRPVRGEHRDPGHRDLRHDRGGQPDHRPSAVGAAACRIGRPARRRGAAHRPAGRARRQSRWRHPSSTSATSRSAARRSSTATSGTRTRIASTRTVGCAPAIWGTRTRTASSTSTPGPTTSSTGAGEGPAPGGRGGHRRRSP